MTPERPNHAPATTTLTLTLSRVLMLGVTFLSFWLFARVISPDLLATWLAGQFYGTGAFDQIYAQDGPLFRMYPPAEWHTFMADLGYERPVFPFVYPPLWAWLASFVPDYDAFRSMGMVAGAINPALLMGCIILGQRITKSPLDPLAYVTVALLLLLGTKTGLLALVQNQPQIAVSFLILLAIERDRADAPVAAGVALALASALKIYPAVFALFWLARRRNRACLWFAAVLGALVALSYALAGVALHQAFIAELSRISNTALVTRMSFNLDPAIAQLFHADALQEVPAYVLDSTTADPAMAPGWYALQKGAVWALSAKLVLLCALIGLSLWARKVETAFFWPLAITIIALLSPLSWNYHFIPAFVFLPALLTRFGARGGTIALMLIGVPLSLPVFELFRNVAAAPLFSQIVGTAVMVVMAVIFLIAAREKTV